jgi:hypothetical protein
MHAEFKQRWDVCGAKSTDCGASNKRQLRECGKVRRSQHHSSSQLIACALHQCHTVRYCCPGRLMVLPKVSYHSFFIQNTRRSIGRSTRAPASHPYIDQACPSRYIYFSCGSQVVRLCEIYVSRILRTSIFVVISHTVHRGACILLAFGQNDYVSRVYLCLAGCHTVVPDQLWDLFHVQQNS